MYCQNCGKKIGHVKFCPYCGAPQASNNKNESKIHDNFNQYKKGHKHILMWIIILIIIALIVFIPIHKRNESNGPQQQGTPNIYDANKRKRIINRETASMSGAKSTIKLFYTSTVSDASLSGVNTSKKHLNNYNGDPSAGNTGTYFYEFFTNGKSTPGYLQEVNRLDATYKLLKANFSQKTKRGIEFESSYIKSIHPVRINKDTIKVNYIVYYHLFNNKNKKHQFNRVNMFKGFAIIKKTPKKLYRDEGDGSASHYSISELKQSNKPLKHYQYGLTTGQEADENDD